MFKPFLLPVDKRSKLVLTDKVLRLTPFAGDAHKAHGLYITSEDKPEKGDKVLYKNSEILTVRENKGSFLAMDEYSMIDLKADLCKKIVASTDVEVTPNALLPESFVKDYIQAYNLGKPIVGITLETIGVLQSGNHWDLKTLSDKNVVVNGIFFAKDTFTREELIRAMDHAHTEGLLYGQNQNYKSDLHSYDDWIDKNL